MVDALISLLIFVIILAVIVWIIKYILDLLPLPAPFGQIAWVLLLLIALLLVLRKAWPLLAI